MRPPYSLTDFSHPHHKYLHPRRCRLHISHFFLFSCTIIVSRNDVFAFASPILSHRSGHSPSFTRCGSSMHNRTTATGHLQRCAGPKTYTPLSQQHRQLQHSFSRLGSRQSTPPRELCACSQGGLQRGPTNPKDRI